MPSESHPRRQTERLHRGRISTHGATYFLTLVTFGRKSWMNSAIAARIGLEALRTWHNQRDGFILAATIMPDHVHVLFTLGPDSTVGQCVGRFKACVRRALGYRESWQRDFWEHRLRAQEDWEDYGLYAFLNPYRAGLIRHHENWPWWWAPDPSAFRFTALLETNGCPPRKWLSWPESRFESVQAGE